MPQVLVWSARYATGVAEIDEQHMVLVHTLNEAGMQLTPDASLEKYDQITRDLLTYALYHFETEEELMQEYGYAEAGKEAAAHQEQHRAFFAKVVAMRNDLKAGRRIDPETLLGFLNGWLVNHIQNTDQRLARFILAKRAAP